MTSAHRILWSFHTLTYLSNFEPPFRSNVKLPVAGATSGLLTWWPPVARLPSSHAGCLMSSDLCCLYTTVPELGACSAYFPEIRGREKADPPCINDTIFTKKYTNGNIQAQFALDDLIADPSPWQRWVRKLPCAPVPSGLLTQRSSPTRKALAILPCIPAGTSTHGYLQLLLDKELVLLWYTFLQSTIGAHKGKRLYWLQSFLFRWATASVSPLPLQGTSDLPAASKSTCYLNVLWRNIWKGKGKRNATFDTGGETSRGHCVFKQKHTS